MSSPGFPPLPPGAGECEGSPLASLQRRPWRQATIREAAADWGGGKAHANIPVDGSPVSIRWSEVQRAVSRKWVARVLVSWIAAAATAAGTEASEPKIRVGPNILVSRDGDIPHVELHVSANPKNAKNLVGGAITFTRPGGGLACRAYSTTDGGFTWKMSEFPDQVEWGGGDPYTAFTPQGTAIFSALAEKKDETGKNRGFLHVYRSEKGGHSWSDAIELGYSYDHEQIAVDLTTGKYSGRIYIGALYGPYPVYRVGVFRSEDDGRTWVGPVEAANGGGEIGINVVTPLVLSDGTLVVPYADYPFLPEKRPSKGKAPSHYWTVASTDGGVTFSAPRKAQTQIRNLDEREKQIAAFAKFAADTESKRFRDRIYMVWEDGRQDSYRIFFSRSLDRGKTWSPPRLVDGVVAAATHQFQPALAVNKDGVLAMTWFDTRHSTDGSEYHQYFAASLDGGETFLPSVRVSSAPSRPKGEGNRRLTPYAWAHKGRMILSFHSAGGWTAGGHYMGLAADKDGYFHPFWVDARSGTSQIYTARVQIETPPSKEEANPEIGGPRASLGRASPPTTPATTLLGKIELVFDPTHYDAEKNELAVPMRLRNGSQSVIHPPIRIEFVGFGWGEPEGEDDREFWKDKMATIVNASNGKPGAGAIFEFDGALAGSEVLEPGAQTNPVVVRLKLDDPFFAPYMQWDVTGRVAEAK